MEQVSGPRNWWYEVRFKATDATEKGEFPRAVKQARQQLIEHGAHGTANESELVLGVMVQATSEDEACAKGFDLVDAALDKVMTWTHRESQSTRVLPQ